MPNPKGNIASLRSFKSPWNHKQTRTIRVPVVLADQILEYARKIDANSKARELSVTVFDTDANQLKEAIQTIKEIIESKPNSTLTKAKRLKLTKVLEFLNASVEIESLTHPNQQPLEILEAIGKLESQKESQPTDTVK